MFSGIIEEIGIVKGLNKRGKVVLLKIQALKVLEHTKTGDSISINGVCLTVVAKEKSTLSFEVMEETYRLTNLGLLHIKDKVNLERALKVGERISGHFVSGHIDAMGIIRKKTFIRNNLCYEISFPRQLSKYIVPKGSVSIDGISLTVVDIRGNKLSVYVIPHTLKNTTLGFKNVGSKVNIECDMLAKFRKSPRI